MHRLNGTAASSRRSMSMSRPRAHAFARRATVLALAGLAFVLGAGCSPGALPGVPSPITVAGGGARYAGSIIITRVSGPYTLPAGAQPLNLSVVVRDEAQMTGRFDAGPSSGTVQGVLNGTLSGGTFAATFLISTPATASGGAASACEGRGDINVTIGDGTLFWSGGTVVYDNCPGLTVSTSAQATAQSPIPGSFGSRGNVILAIPGGAVVAPGTCPSGGAGYPFTVEMIETSGVTITFEDQFIVEERRNFAAVARSTFDMPFTELGGGQRRTYDVCSSAPGTYQAFFSGTDANGNRVRVASPLATFGAGPGGAPPAPTPTPTPTPTPSPTPGPTPSPSPTPAPTPSPSPAPPSASFPGCSMTNVSINTSTDGTLSDGDCSAPHRAPARADFFQFTGNAGQRVRIEMTSNGLPDPYLFLLSSSGGVLAENDDIVFGENLVARIDITLPSTGTYFVEATSFNFDERGAYRLALQTLSSQTTGSTQMLRPRAGSRKYQAR